MNRIDIPPGIGSNSFKLVFKDNWIKRDYILEDSKGMQLKILSKPKKVWYKLILQYLTFGLYKAPWQYCVGIIETTPAINAPLDI